MPLAIADQFVYSAVDLGAISVPFLFSFHPKLRFHREWKHMIPAIVITAIFFLVWDAFFTHWGVWGFNDRYLLGPRIAGMPIEEYAFFICIPYACLFTYHCFNVFFGDKLRGTPAWWHWSVPLICVGFIVFGWGNYYTMTTAVFLLILYLLHLLYWKSEYLNLFLLTYLVLIIPFYITNGILTGSGIEDEVVWYNNAENLGIRMGTIPVEDIFYGMLMILCSVTLYHHWKKPAATHSKKAKIV